MELLDRFLGDDDSESDGAADGDDMLFEEDGADDFGGDDGFDDGFDDGLGFDDDGEGGGAATAELEGRIDEMENEVASLSSTVSTIRSENEEISNTVEDVEENVRKLLDIYEMVTRGVNPFVDDVQGGAGGGLDGGGGSLGLFDDDEDDPDEDLDDDIAGAEAEEFFDDDFLDENDAPDGGFDDSFDGGTIDDGSTTTDTMPDDSDDSDDSGKSFDELKDEYESGDAEWAGEGDATNGGSTGFSEGSDDDFGGADGIGGEVGDDFDGAGGFDEGSDDDFGGADGTGGEVGDDFGETGEFDEGSNGDFGGMDASDDADIPDSEPASEPTADPEPDPEPEAEPTHMNDTRSPQSAGQPAQAQRQRPEDTGEGAGDLQFAANTMMNDGKSMPTKPYLTHLPSGYVGDLLIMEWLEYLIEESDVNDAARAVEYYRRIQWLGEDAADELLDFLVGFGEVDEDVTGAPTDLSIDHHVASLRYVSRLTGSTADSVVFECWSGGGGVPFGL
ncbi:FlaD/FlaE family flagellar protein [Haloplanus sp.]|uniref:FlaD/FlaE family flagellar protein n=1 Tax=Haloplanus sp. TaxID=1961696 RepID=UPI00260C2254|nr:FlaD/FlaE family flagellar protein [Haloplanus sp.]